MSLPHIANDDSPAKSRTQKLEQMARRAAPWFIAVLMVIALVLLIRILWAPTTIGSPTTESDALIRTNERLLQLVQWTIATILTIGGALIGLNWYQSTHRYEQDKEALQRIRTDVDMELKSGLKLIEQQISALQEASSTVESQLLESLTEQLDQRLSSVEHQGGSGDQGQVESGSNLRSEQKSGWAAFWDNVVNREAGKRLSVESTRFLNPNPFGDMAAERKQAIEAIESVLGKAYGTGLSADEVVALGAIDVWKTLPLMAIDYPLKAEEIQSLLESLNVPKPKSRDSDSTQ